MPIIYIEGSIMIRKFFIPFLLALAVFCGCKSKPPIPMPEGIVVIPNPAASIHLKITETQNPNEVSFDLVLRAGNPRHDAAGLNLESRRLLINGVEVNRGFSLTPDKIGTTVPGISKKKPGTADTALRLNLDLKVLSAEGFSLVEDMELAPEFDCVFAYQPEPNAETEHVNVKALGKFTFTPVQRPVLTITEIAVIKDELINTKFRVKLDIYNPNPFPVELSSFEYELFGNSRFWADGKERNVFAVGGLKSQAAQLRFSMNFIDMRRNLLDQVINLKDVNYRFKGDAVVATGVEYIPRFSNPFDLSGLSRVLER